MPITRLDRYLFLSFLQPLVVTFSVSMFVLLMQFLWKYIDDLVGKGLSPWVIAELLGYATTNLIPMALPLAVLLASIMTFGNMGEKYELVAMRSAGIPLRRMLVPMLVFALLVSGIAFFIANNVIPTANLKFGALYYDVRQAKPAFDLKDGVFYNDLEGYSIKVGKKEKDGETLHDVLIYDHSSGRGNTTVTRAESGKMGRSADKRFLFFTLYNGATYDEMFDNPDYYASYPHTITSFKRQQVVFDLSQFNLSRTAEDLFKHDYRFKNIDELDITIDSLRQQKANRDSILREMLAQNYLGTRRSETKHEVPHDSILVGLYPVPDSIMKSAVIHASAILRSVKGNVDYSAMEMREYERNIAKHQVELHRKFTLSLACLVLFLIGAPLGAIVRKGGFGLPVVVAIVLFMVFYIINIFSEKMVRELIVPPFPGVWFSIFLFTPIGIMLIRRTDGSQVNWDRMTRFFKREKKVATAPAIT